MRRDILSKQYGIKKENLCFSYTGKGRPYLTNYKAIDFNISHTDNYVVMAVGIGQSVGIDVQLTKEEVNFLAIAKNYFSADEYSTLCQLSKDSQRSFFYQVWTLKEASLKLIGDGISNRLSLYTFGIRNGKTFPSKFFLDKKINYCTANLDKNTFLSLASDKVIDTLSMYYLCHRRWYSAPLAGLAMS